MKTLLLILCLLTFSNIRASDTTRVDIYYSYTDCKLYDTTVAAAYNNHCLFEERGYMVEVIGGYIFLTSKKQRFIKPIVVWYYIKLKQ